MNKTPQKLIKVNLDNISNNELLKIFDRLLISLKNVNIQDPFMVELDKDYINFVN